MEENDNKEGLISTLVNKGVKSAWEKLPTTLKIKIIGGAGIILVSLIIFLAIIGSFSTSALAYSDEAMSAADIKELRKEFEDNWYDLCESGECNEKLIENQKKFYDQLDKMVDKYKLNREQKYILLTTIFYEYNIEDFINGITYDENEGSETEDIYAEEKDTIKNLAKRFKSGESDNKSYYDYLITSDFLDKRAVLNSYFEDYASANNKSVSNLSKEDREAVRTTICNNIKDIVADYMNEEKKSYTTITPSGTGYWWPIGSLETTEEDGKLFATGNPEKVNISSYFTSRVHPITGAYQAQHSGIDIPANANSSNVIASLDGEVIDIYNSCKSISDVNNNSDITCGGGYGNYIKIKDSKGNIEIYAHLYKDSMTVSKNDLVKQGQVIAKVGSSGSSTGPHLHFTIMVNGSAVDPLEYVDPEKPRSIPASGEFDFHNTVYSKEEFIAVVNNYYENENSCNGISRCLSLRDDILNGDGARIIYEVATEKNINPELIFPRMMLEGYASGIGHNYFSYGCGNTTTLYVCSHGFSSFREAVEAFFDNASQYDSLYSMMLRYGYVGYYWYNEEAVNKDCCDANGKNCKCGAAGVGGCILAPLIYGDSIPARVASACSHTTCSHVNTSDCVATTEEDQQAYAAYQVRVMASVRERIFK